MKVLFCNECGCGCVRSEDGITNHVTDDNDIDYNLDADHVALPENEESLFGEEL